MNIGIYGGTFNPPHLGHFKAAQGAVEVLGLDKLLLIPTASPPHKVMDAMTPPVSHRLAMTQRMADCLGTIAEVSTIELDRGGASYTVDTLQALKECYPEDQLWLLLGSDMFLSLEGWKDPETIMALANLATFSRLGGEEWQTMTAYQEKLKKTYGAMVKVLSLPEAIEVSSTELRGELAQCHGSDKLLPSVYGYLMMEGLYGLDVDLTSLTNEQLRACNDSMIKAKRIPHIRGTEQEAVKLAQRWGADPELACKAAILHDCTKYWSYEAHIALCDAYGLELDALEREGVKLLHAKSGAIVAREVFGMPEAVVEAISWHTTAKEDMTLLEQVLYLADYMEPCRSFEGVEDLRHLAYTDLTAALLMGLDMSVDEMKERGRTLHPRTSEARAWLVHEKGL